MVDYKILIKLSYKLLLLISHFAILTFIFISQFSGVQLRVHCVQKVHVCNCTGVEFERFTTGF